MSNPATTEPVLVDKAKVTTSPVWMYFGYWVNKEVNPTASEQSSAICDEVRREWQHQYPTVSL